MSSDFFTNKQRVDIVTGCTPGKGVYKTWNDVVRAVLSGEKVIRTSMYNKTTSKYTEEG